MPGIDQAQTVRPQQPHLGPAAGRGNSPLQFRPLFAGLLETGGDDGYGTGTGLDRVFHRRQDQTARHRNNRQIDGLAEGRQVRVARQGQDLGRRRIDRHEGAAEAAVYQVLEDIVADFARRPGSADNRDRFRSKEFFEHKFSFQLEF